MGTNHDPLPRAIAEDIAKVADEHGILHLTKSNFYGQVEYHSIASTALVQISKSHSFNFLSPAV